MTSRQPARTAVRDAQPTAYRARRRRVLLAAVLVVLLAATGRNLVQLGDAAFAAAGHALNGKTHLLNHGTRLSLSPVRWPQQGQAALVLSNGRPASSPHEQPVAIASLAKVMTAYLVLERYPLSGVRNGFTITASAAEAQAVAQYRAEGQSVVMVAAGEQLTERQLLEALLIPSANNIAEILAAQVAGSETRFIAEMNDEALALEMDDTTYTDPSGFAPNTVSTAAAQLRVFQQAMRLSVFRQIVSMGSVTLPVAGMLTNFNPLVADGYAGKTGSDSAARGCLAFFTHVTVASLRLTAVGVVLGQGQGSDTSALLAAAGEAAEQLVESVTPAIGVRTIAASGAARGLTSRRLRPRRPPAATHSWSPLRTELMSTPLATRRRAHV